MTPIRHPHLWLALSPHGFGHAAMTAPVIAEVRRRRPGLRLTIQTAVPETFLRGRYGDDFTLVPEIPDFGLRMMSATDIDLEASARGYRALHADWDGLLRREAARLAERKPDAVLSNVAYVPLAAAARAGIPAMALGSLQWLDIYRHFLGDRSEAPAVMGRMRAAYEGAPFLRVTPAMDMPGLSRVRDIGPVGAAAEARRAELAQLLGAGEGERIGLIAFGGIDHALDLARWPRLPGWRWLTTVPCPPERPDFLPVRGVALDYRDMAASVDVVVTKPGYGTFVEAVLNRVPVLYTPRPDWPECPHLDDWLKTHGRARGCALEEMLGGGLFDQLQALFSLKIPPVIAPTGNAEAADALEGLLDGGGVYCIGS